MIHSRPWRWSAYLALSLLLLPAIAAPAAAQAFTFQEGDRVSYIGNALADRKQHDGWLETHLQAAHPGYDLVFRNLGYAGDQVHHRPRAHEGFGDPDTHLAHNQATVVFAFFGYNESFDDNPDQFKGRLREWIDHTLDQQYDGHNPPRIVLFSPIAHEDLGDPNFPDGAENNRRLAAYTQAMAEVAQEKDVTYVDLFAASQSLYGASEQPLTINGVHLNAEGNRQIARVITQSLLGTAPDADDAELESLRQAVLEKNWHWFNRYRAPSGNDVWGSRAELHGNFETLQQELRMLDVMTANRDKRVWARAQGDDIEIDDANVPPPDEVETNFNQDIRFLSGEDAIDKMHLADGLKVNLFACEEMFPEIANPVQMQLDTQGRLWVAAWPTYPKWEPLKEMNDGLIILEDTTGDGVADTSTRFADVHNPTGFEFWNGGVIVASAPNLVFLKDTTGDNKADYRVKIMGAIDHGDTHHTANNLLLGPDGFLYYQRGVFHRHNVETPWGPSQTGTTSGLYRFNPRTHQFDFVVDNSPNPHGISFDRWGYHYITDATSGSPFQVYVDGDGFEKRRLFQQTVRPVPGNQVLVSEHLPEDYWDNFLIYNTIGFLGIKRYQLTYDNGAVTGEEIGDLMYSDDPNFRPTHGVIGNDGAFYISDWQNPIIGHMQHNLRDPSRDHDHGRIYRITAEGRDLATPVAIHGEPIEDLLELLKHPVDGIRHRVRIELSGRDTVDVVTAAQNWAEHLDADDALPLLEALWLHQQHNIVNRELLDKVRQSPVEHARFAAERVAFEWGDRPDDDVAERAADADDAAHGSHHGHAAHAADHASGGDANGRAGKAVDLTGHDVAAFTITAIVEQMRFDITEFTVRVGQPVELTLDNPDFMPHNLLIVNPGTADQVAMAAIELGAQGFAKQFVPDTPDVLHATRMLNANEKQTLEFTAPSTPGDYDYVCTFPGHATLMRGIMKVVD